MHATTPMAQPRRANPPVPVRHDVPSLAPLKLVPPEVLSKPVLPKRPPTYGDIAQKPMGRFKLWLGYGVVYRGLCYLPTPWRARLAQTTRNWLGVEDDHSDLMALIEHGLDDDTTRWPT